LPLIRFSDSAQLVELAFWSSNGFAPLRRCKWRFGVLQRQPETLMRWLGHSDARRVYDLPDSLLNSDGLWPRVKDPTE